MQRPGRRSPRLAVLVLAITPLLPSSAHADECARTADCESGERCVKRQCRAKVVGERGDTCRADADCGDGLSCESGECRTAANARVSGRGVGATVETTLASEEVRAAWIARGGWITSYEVRAQATGLVTRKQTVPVFAFCTSGTAIYPQRTEVQGVSGGGGGGLGARIGALHLNPPNGKSTWSAFRFSVGGDVSYLGYRYLTGGRASCGGTAEPEFTNLSALQLSLPASLGAMTAIGTGGTGTSWSGIVLGVAYTPTLTYFKASGADGSLRLNPIGAEFSLDVTTLEAALEKQAKPAHFRAAALFIPSIKEDWPWMLTLSLGAVWY